MATPDRYILGLGTGRCGTHSLAALLDAQPKVCARYKRGRFLPWAPSEGDIRTAIRWLEQGGECVGHLWRPVMADVGYMWINALPTLRQRFGERLTVVALRRGREETIESFMATYPHLIRKRETKAQRQFPTYDDVPVEEAWGRWWDWYYDQLPEEEIFSTQLLNSRSGQGKILAHCAVPKAERIYIDDLHKNRR